MYNSEYFNVVEIIWYYYFYASRMSNTKKAGTSPAFFIDTSFTYSAALAESVLPALARSVSSFG